MSSGSDQPRRHIAASFSSAVDKVQPKECGRSNCNTKIFPPETKFEPVFDQGGNKVGKMVCTECYLYYQTKADTRYLGMTSHIRHFSEKLINEFTDDRRYDRALEEEEHDRKRERLCESIKAAKRRGECCKQHIF